MPLIRKSVDCRGMFEGTKLGDLEFEDFMPRAWLSGTGITAEYRVTVEVHYSNEDIHEYLRLNQYVLNKEDLERIRGLLRETNEEE